MPGGDNQLHWWICFLLPCIAVGRQAATENDQLALLEGSVVHAVTKEPVQKAHVTLEQSEGPQDSALVATTDEAGRFRFAGIKAGQYKLTAEKSGFLDGAYGGAEPEDGGSLLKVTGGDRLHDLTLRLFPGATISGQVMDADGDPVPGDEVILWARRHRHGQITNSSAGHTGTNHAGEYRFDGLSPGTYYVSASVGTWGYATRQIPVDSSGKETRVHDLTTFYPAALSLADAQGVSVEVGQGQSGIDIRIQRGATWSVKGRIAGMSRSTANYSISARVAAGLGWTSEAGRVLPNGDFEFRELPPGKQLLSLLEHGPNGVQVIGSTEVNLIDQDVAGVVIAPFRPAQVRVRVVVEGEEDKPLTKGRVSLMPAHEPEDSLRTFLQYPPQNSTYVIDGVPPGKYRVWFNNASDCYLKSVLSGERMVDSESIDVAEGAVLDLLMTFSRNVASISGDVDPPQGQPNPSVHVLVISEEPGEHAEVRHRWPELDQTLHFSIARLRPGKYISLAVQDDNPDLWENSAFVKSFEAEGTAIELHEKENATVHLKVIPKEETDGARKRLGL